MISPNNRSQSAGFRAACLQSLFALGLGAMISLTSSTSAHAQARGIAIWKQSTSHPTAHHFEFTEMRNNREVHQFRLANGSTQNLNMFQLIGVAEYFEMPHSIHPDLGSRLITPYLTRHHQILRECPAAAVVLRPRILEMEDAIRRMQAGEVRHNGDWITRAAFEQERTDEAEREKREELERENRRRDRRSAEVREVPLVDTDFVRRFREQQENKRRHTK